MKGNSFFNEYVIRALDYHHTLIDSVSTDPSEMLRLKRDTLRRTIHIGLQIPDTVELAVQLLLNVFPLIERWKIAHEWLDIFERASNVFSKHTTELGLKIKNRLGQTQRLSHHVDSAIQTHKDVLSNLETIHNNTILKARVHFNLCEDYRVAGQLPEAEFVALSALELLDEGDEQCRIIDASIRNSLGLIYTAQKKYPKAISIVEPALNHWEAIENQLTEWGRTLNTQAIAYQHNKEFEKANQTYLMAIEKLKGTDSHAERLRVYAGLSWLRMEQNRYHDACDLLEAAVQEAEEISADIETKGILHTNIANAYIHLGRYSEARKTHNLNIVFWRKLGAEVMVANSIGGLGEILKLEGKFIEALNKYNEAIVLLRKYPKSPQAIDWEQMYSKKRDDLMSVLERES